MTTVYQIIVDAYRQSNLNAIGIAPTQLQETEALTYLNRIVKSVFGYEAGDRLLAFPIGREGITRPSGYPWWNTTPDNSWFVPEDTRLMMNVSQSLDLYLHPSPNDGARLAVNDVNGTLGTYPLTLHGNGRLIDGSETLVINTNSFEGEWFYRDDLATWVKYAPLAMFDTFPFPEEFDDFFILTLAFRLNPAYQRQFDEQGMTIWNRSRNQLRARYTRDDQVRSELALIRPTKTATDRDQWGNTYWLYNPNSMFDKGWPW